MKNLLSRTKCSACCCVIIVIVLMSFYYIELLYDADIQILIETFNFYTKLHGEYCNVLKRNYYDKYYRYYNKDYDMNFSLSESRKRVLLMSYPRSGNHLTRGILECLLDYPTYGYLRETYSIYKQQTIGPGSALKKASKKRPFIRKYHSIKHIHTNRKYGQFGLIFLMRDPLECILSETKTKIYFWRNYEKEIKELMDLTNFYINWNNTNTKLLLYYEDYFNISVKWINLLKIQSYFGKDRITDNRLKFCMDNFENITNSILNALTRPPQAMNNLHHYRDEYYGTNPDSWPVIKVPPQQYKKVFHRYENLKPCH